MTIRVLDASDVEAYRRVRLNGLKTDPEAFGSTYEREVQFSRKTMLERVLATDDKFVLGAFDEGTLVGVVTFVRESGVKERHKGNVFGMYLIPEARGKGIGAWLLRALLEKACGMEGLERINLTVVSDNVWAKRLYEAAGFRRYGTECGSLKSGGRYFDEDLMALDLETLRHGISKTAVDPKP
jgi:RimJ/RimL family protein N-acetyltransferase